jgi:hypothetical protein
MNLKQKRILIYAAVIIIVFLIIWVSYGGHIFTRTQVLIEKKDDLFPDMVQKEWVNKFVWGLDLSLVLSIITIFTGSILFFLFRDKRKSTEPN